MHSEITWPLTPLKFCLKRSLGKAELVQLPFNAPTERTLPGTTLLCFACFLWTPFFCSMYRNVFWSWQLYTIGWNYIRNHTIFLILYDFIISKIYHFWLIFQKHSYFRSTIILVLCRLISHTIEVFFIIGQVPKKVVPYVQFILYLKRPDWRWISKFSSNFKCLFTFFLFCWGKSNKN